MVLLVEVPDVALLDGGEHGGDLGHSLLLSCEGRLEFADLSNDVGVASHGKMGPHAREQSIIGLSGMEFETPEGGLVGLQGVQLEPGEGTRGKVHRCMACCSHLRSQFTFVCKLKLNHLRCDHPASVGTCGSVVDSPSLSCLLARTRP